MSPAHDSVAQTVVFAPAIEFVNAKLVALVQMAGP